MLDAAPQRADIDTSVARVLNGVDQSGHHFPGHRIDDLTRDRDPIGLDLLARLLCQDRRRGERHPGPSRSSDRSGSPDTSRAKDHPSSTAGITSATWRTAMKGVKSTMKAPGPWIACVRGAQPNRSVVLSRSTSTTSSITGFVS